LPTIISHPAAALLQPRHTPVRVTIAAIVATILPDLDTISFKLGIPYGSPYGHRGFTHSIAFALASSLLLTLITRRDARTFAFLFVCAISHPLLDAVTDGGRGVALLWPLTAHRYFAPWRPIIVSPIGRLDLRVLWSEVKWVWAPFIAARILWRGRSRARAAAAS
jgi:inner membrane protein